MKLKKWPFLPVHITNDGESYVADHEVNALTGEGLISHHQMRAQLVGLAAELQTATQIIEFAPDGALILTTLPPNSVQSSPVSERFVEVVDLPYGSENFVAPAHLFYGLTRDQFVNEIPSRIERDATIREYQAKTNIECIFIDDPVRPRLDYDCPFLGFRATLFPIFYQSYLIGVFVATDLVLEHRCLFVRQRLEAIIQSHPGIFDAYTKASGEMNNLQVKDSLIDEFARWTAGGKNILTPQAHKKLINRSLEQLKDFEEMLLEQATTQKDHYISFSLERRTREFYSHMPRAISPTQTTLADFWKHVQRIVTAVASDFHIKYFILFGTTQLFSRIDLPLPVAAHGGRLPSRMRGSVLRAAAYDLRLVRSEVLQHPITSDHSPEIFDGIVGLDKIIDPSKDRIRLAPVPFSRDLSVAVLVGYYDDNPRLSAENRAGGALDRSFEAFFSAILSSLSSLIAGAAQANLRDTIRVLGHELGQQSAGLDWLREIYLSDPKTIRDLTWAKANDLASDLDAYITQLRFISSQSSIVTQTPTPRKTEFLAYKELIHKWKDIYRFQAKTKSLGFSVAHPRAGDPAYPPVYGDKTLLEQLIYNLVNNAVKYAYRGTLVHIDCPRLISAPGAPHVMSVLDFGMAADGEHLMNLFTRGKHIEGIEGVGIGLYIASQIAEAHGGELTIRSRQVSAYNVPLIEAYLVARPKGAKDELLSALSPELERLRVLGDLQRAIALGENGKPRYHEPTERALTSEIELPTFEVTVTATIPTREDHS